MQHRCSPYCHRGLPEIPSHIIVTFTHWYWDTSQILAIKKYLKYFRATPGSTLLSTGWKPFRPHYIAKLRVIKAFEWDHGRHFSVVSPQDQLVSVSERETIINLASRGSFHTLQHQPKNDIKEYLGVELSWETSYWEWYLINIMMNHKNMIIRSIVISKCLFIVDLLKCNVSLYHL